MLYVIRLLQQQSSTHALYFREAIQKQRNGSRSRGPDVLLVKPASANPDNLKKRYTIVVDGDAEKVTGGPAHETANDAETIKTRNGRTVISGRIDTGNDAFKVSGEIKSVEDESGKIKLVRDAETISSPGNHIGGGGSAGGGKTTGGDSVAAAGAFSGDIFSTWNNASMPTKVAVGLGGLGALTFVGTQMLPE